MHCDVFEQAESKAVADSMRKKLVDAKQFAADARAIAADGLGPRRRVDSALMGETANPTTAGMHNHFSRPRRPHDPSNPRKAIDAVFGDNGPIIEGLAD